MKMKPLKAKAAPAPRVGGKGTPGKPHIRMRKLKPVPAGAFPQSAAAFPTDPAAPSPDQAMTAQPGGMPTGAAPGTMGE